MSFDRKAYMRRWMRERQARWAAARGCLDCGQPTTRFRRCLRHRMIQMESYYHRQAKA